jgi:hypothetical protein
MILAKYAIACLKQLRPPYSKQRSSKEIENEKAYDVDMDIGLCDGSLFDNMGLVRRP